MTPSFEKRMRHNVGNRATFNFNNKTRSVIVKDVIWNPNTKSYSLKGKSGAVTYTFPTNKISRPVRYS